MPTAFLSFAHEDAPAARRISEFLLENGIDTFNFEMIAPGSNVGQAIEDGIRSASALIVLLSSNFARSEWGRIEVATAVAEMAGGHPKRIFPVLIADDFDTAQMPSTLKRYRSLDLSDGIRRDSLEPLVRAILSVESPPDLAEELGAEERSLLIRQFELDRERREYEVRRLRAEATRARRSAIVAMASGLLAAILASTLVVVWLGQPSGLRTIIVAAVGAILGSIATLVSVRWSRTERRGRRQHARAD